MQSPSIPKCKPPQFEQRPSRASSISGCRYMSLDAIRTRSPYLASNMARSKASCPSRATSASSSAMRASAGARAAVASSCDVAQSTFCHCKSAIARAASSTRCSGVMVRSLVIGRSFLFSEWGAGVAGVIDARPRWSAPSSQRFQYLLRPIRRKTPKTNRQFRRLAVSLNKEWRKLQKSQSRARQLSRRYDKRFGSSFRGTPRPVAIAALDLLTALTTRSSLACVCLFHSIRQVVAWHHATSPRALARAWRAVLSVSTETWPASASAR
jgi:hypothetical protein